MEQKLNINIDIVNSIDTYAGADGDSYDSLFTYRYGFHVDHILKSGKQNINPLHSEPCQEIYDTLASDDLDDSDRQQIIENLIKFYVGHNFAADVGKIGFLSHRADVETYLVESMPDRAGRDIVNQLKHEFGLKVAHQFLKDSNKMSFLFDCSQQDLEDILQAIPELDSKVKSVDKLPEWAKKTILF